MPRVPQAPTRPYLLSNLLRFLGPEALASADFSRLQTHPAPALRKAAGAVGRLCAAQDLDCARQVFHQHLTEHSLCAPTCHPQG